MSEENQEQSTIIKTYPYLDLLSDNSPKAFKEYEEDVSILQKQIDKPDVYNIAVVAKYGAGKSSVINTYLSLYRNKKTRREKKETGKDQLAMPKNNKYTRISLSTFNKNDYDETAIERSILQQLLYSRNKEKLPNSRIERTNRSSRLRSFLFAALLTVFIVSTALMVMEFSLFGRPVNTAGATSLFGLNWVKYFLLAFSALLLFFILLWMLHYRKLRKIKYKDLEADIYQRDEKNESKQVTNLINKFIDEVLYFFECVDIDLVIFEDLDRLPTTEIFVKLRELNTIINSSAKRAKKVTFLYAVKDELFKTDEERAKFFEFILSVVPVINPVTTKSEMENKLDELTKKNKEMQLSGKLIKGISIYIPDMRILNNTFNDYVMMFHKIFEDINAGKNLKTDNLFALCLYKNLFPYDYALLEKNEGLIPLVINIDLLKNKCLTQINDKVKERREQLTKIQNETVASFEELKGIFISKLYECDKSNTVGSIDPWEITTFKDIDFLAVKHPYIPDNNYNYGYAIKPKDGSEVLTPRGERFIDVENNIKLKEQNGIEKIEKEIAELEKQRQNILSWGLAEIVSSLGVNKCFPDDLITTYNEIINATLTERDNAFLKFLSSKYVKKIDNDVVTTIRDAYKTFKEEELPKKKIKLQIKFLRFLVAQDYIDEHYIEYTSNYKADILSHADVKAVQTIQGREENFDAKFENVSEVIRWLDDNDFSFVSILNKSFLDSINLIKDLSKKEKDKKFDNMVGLLSNTENSTVIDILQKYISTAEVSKCEQLLKILISKRTSLCSEVLSDNVLSEEKKDFVFICYIKYSKKFIKHEENAISNYISYHKDYLRLFRRVRDDNKVIEFLDNIQPSFILIEQNLNGKIQQHIIKSSLFQLNLENLEIIYNVDKSDLSGDFYTKNYETVLAGGNTDVREYIEKNINNYVFNVLLNQNVSCKNEPITLIDKLLKNEAVALETRNALIAKINVKFDSIAELNPELFKAIFDNDKVAPDWVNIQFAYERKGIECVKDFIKQKSKIEGEFVGCEGINKDTPTKLVNDILLHLNTEEIKNIAATLPAVTSLSAIKNEVSEDNLSNYISKGRIKFINTDLSLLFERAKSLCEYIKINSEKIQKDFNTFFAEIIPNKVAQRKQVLENGYYVYKDVIEYIEKEHTQRTLSIILGHKGIDIAIKKKLLNECLEVVKIEGHEQVYVNYIVDEKQAVPPKILWQFSKTSLPVETKLELLAICDYGGKTLDAPKLTEYLISFGNGFKDLFGANKKANIAKMKGIKNLLDVLYGKKIIKSYKKARNKEEYTVIAA